MPKSASSFCSFCASSLLLCTRVTSSSTLVSSARAVSASARLWSVASNASACHAMYICWYCGTRLSCSVQHCLNAHVHACTHHLRGLSIDSCMCMDMCRDMCMDSCWHTAFAASASTIAGCSRAAAAATAVGTSRPLAAGVSSAAAMSSAPSSASPRLARQSAVVRRVRRSAIAASSSAPAPCASCVQRGHGLCVLTFCNGLGARALGFGLGDLLCLLLLCCRHRHDLGTLASHVNAVRDSQVDRPACTPPSHSQKPLMPDKIDSPHGLSLCGSASPSGLQAPRFLHDTQPIGTAATRSTLVIVKFRWDIKITGAHAIAASMM